MQVVIVEQHETSPFLSFFWSEVWRNKNFLLFFFFESLSAGTQKSLLDQNTPFFIVEHLHTFLKMI